MRSKVIRGHSSLQTKKPKQCVILILKMSLFTNITTYTFTKVKDSEPFNNNYSYGEFKDKGQKSLRLT